MSEELIIESLELLELLTVSLDRLKGAPADVVGFLESRSILDQVASLRAKMWAEAEQILDGSVIGDLEMRLENLPFWTSR